MRTGFRSVGAQPSCQSSGCQRHLVFNSSRFIFHLLVTTPWSWYTRALSCWGASSWTGLFCRLQMKVSGFFPLKYLFIFILLLLLFSWRAAHTCLLGLHGWVKCPISITSRLLPAGSVVKPQCILKSMLCKTPHKSFFYPSNRREITATSSLLLINSSKNVTVDTVFARNGFFLLHLAVDYLVCFDRTVSPWCQSILFFFFFYKLLVASERPFLRPAHYCFFLLFSLSSHHKVPTLLPGGSLTSLP